MTTLCPNPTAYPCAFCGALPGQPCTSNSGILRNTTHFSRGSTLTYDDGVIAAVVALKAVPVPADDPRRHKALAPEPVRDDTPYWEVHGPAGVLEGDWQTAEDLRTRWGIPVDTWSDPTGAGLSRAEAEAIVRAPSGGGVIGSGHAKIAAKLRETLG